MAYNNLQKSSSFNFWVDGDFQPKASIVTNSIVHSVKTNQGSYYMLNMAVVII